MALSLKRMANLFFASIIMSRYHDAIKYLHTITNHDTTIVRSRRLCFLMLHCAEFHCLKYAWHYWTCLRHFPRVLVYRTSNHPPLWVPLLFKCSDFEVFETSSTSPARPIPKKLNLLGRRYRVPSMTKWITTTGIAQCYLFTIIYPHTKQKSDGLNENHSIRRSKMWSFGPKVARSPPNKAPSHPHIAHRQVLPGSRYSIAKGTSIFTRAFFGGAYPRPSLPLTFPAFYGRFEWIEWKKAVLMRRNEGYLVGWLGTWLRLAGKCAWNCVCRSILVEGARPETSRRYTGDTDGFSMRFQRKHVLQCRIGSPWKEVSQLLYLMV